MSASKKLFSLFVYLVMSLFHFHFGRIALLIQNCWLNSSFSFCLQVSITSNETLANSIFFSYLFIYLNLGVFLFFLIFIFTLFYFTILNWFCHTLTWIHHGCTWVPKHEPPSRLLPHIISLECKLVQPLWRKVWRFLKKLQIELPSDPAIPLLGIHTEEIRVKETHVPQCSLQHCLY